MSIGDGGFVPRSVEAIWKSRFGDCKDASRLLVAVLEALGVEAAPALVNSQLGYGLTDWPPSPILFDHCVVRIRLGEEVVWLDPTRYPQGGDLRNLARARYGWALPLTPDAELEFMGDSEVMTILEVRHDVCFGESATSPADLEIRCIRRSWHADDFRREIAGQGLETVARRHRDYYESRFGRLEVTQAITMADDHGNNEIETAERFRLLEPWRPNEDRNRLSFSTVDEIVHREFSVPRSTRREAPIWLGPRRRVLQETTLRLPRAWEAGPGNGRWQSGPVAAAVNLLVEDERRLVKLRSEVVVSNRLLSPAHALDYFELGERASHAAAVTLSHPAEKDDFTSPSEPPPIYVSSVKPWTRPLRKDFEIQRTARNIWTMFIVLFVLANCSAILLAH